MSDGCGGNAAELAGVSAAVMANKYNGGKLQSDWLLFSSISIKYGEENVCICRLKIVSGVAAWTLASRLWWHRLVTTRSAEIEACVKCSYCTAFIVGIVMASVSPAVIGEVKMKKKKVENENI